MRITEKRNGEPVGRVLAHPLQREFERSLTRVLGSQEIWKFGDRISMSEFRNIQNKEFVHNQLLARGFEVGKTVSLYVYTGHGLKRSQADKRKEKPKRPDAPVMILEPNNHYGRAEVRRMLRDGVHFSTESLCLKRKTVISRAIFYFRKKEEMPILSETLRKKKGLGASGAIYWLDK